MANVMHNNILGVMLTRMIAGITYKVSLHDSTYNGDDEDDNMSDPVTLGELSGTGYTAGHGGAGRKTVANLTVTVDDPNNQAELDADDITWSGIDAGTAATAILHEEGTTDDTDAAIVGTYDFAIATNGGDVTLQVDAEGLMKQGRAAGS